MVLWQHKVAAAAGMSTSYPDTAERGDMCEVTINIKISSNVGNKIGPVWLYFCFFMFMDKICK